MASNIILICNACSHYCSVVFAIGPSGSVTPIWSSNHFFLSVCREQCQDWTVGFILLQSLHSVIFHRLYTHTHRVHQPSPAHPLSAPCTWNSIESSAVIVIGQKCDRFCLRSLRLGHRGRKEQNNSLNSILYRANTTLFTVTWNQCQSKYRIPFT